MVFNFLRPLQKATKICGQLLMKGFLIFADPTTPSKIVYFQREQPKIAVIFGQLVLGAKYS
jgi:hypothetical protein